MAKRRCLSSNIVESDEFFRLPTDAQALYLHLNMISDDDGFVNSAQSATARIKNGKKSLSILVEKRFVLKFGSVYVIKHWRISNSLKNDRVKPLLYSEIAKKIWVKQNKAYTDHPEDGCITLYETRTIDTFFSAAAQTITYAFPVSILIHNSRFYVDITNQVFKFILRSLQ